MLSMKNSLLSTALLLLAGCGSPPQVAYKPPQVPPLPPSISKQQPNLTERLTSLLMPSEKPSDSSPRSQPTGTGPSISSTPASTLTTK